MLRIEYDVKFRAFGITFGRVTGSQNIALPEVFGLVQYKGLIGTIKDRGVAITISRI